MHTILISLFLSFSPQNDKLQPVQIGDDIKISIPAEFTPMTPQDMQQRAASYRKPLALYTDPSRLVSFAVNYSYSRWRPSDLELLMKFYKSSLYSVFTTVEIIDEGIKRFNNKEFAVLEFVSVSAAEDADVLRPIRKYTYLAYTIYDGQTVLFNFSAPESQQLMWEDKVKDMMATAKIKGTGR